MMQLLVIPGMAVERQSTVTTHVGMPRLLLNQGVYAVGEAVSPRLPPHLGNKKTYFVWAIRKMWRPT